MVESPVSPACRTGSLFHQPRLRYSGPCLGTASPSCQRVPFAPNGISYQGSAQAHESRFHQTRNPPVASRALESAGRDTALSQARRTLRSRRELVARHRLAFAQSKGSLCVLIRERIILRASGGGCREDACMIAC